MFSVCVTKHLLERGVTVIHILEEPLLRAHNLCGSRIRQESPYPFRRSAEARYGPQGSGRSAGGSARDKG